MRISKRLFLQAAGSAAIVSALGGCRLSTDITARLCRPRIRRNVYHLLADDPNHPILLAYAEGVRMMKALDVTDPTSWMYQANIHGTTIRGMWPPGAPWNSCRHGEPLFLSWHRLQLLQFERIIAEKTGQADFAMPYWDYDDPDHRALPPPFRMNAGPFASLFEANRGRGWNSGRAGFDPRLTSAATALRRSDYLGPNEFQDSLEILPHNSVHDTFGGLMGRTTTAAQDPIFWLHHCNIDRLQERWLRDPPGHTLDSTLADPAWRSERFSLAAPDGSIVEFFGRDMLPAGFNYLYDEDYTPEFQEWCRRARSGEPQQPPQQGPSPGGPGPSAGIPAELPARPEVRRSAIDLAAESLVSIPLSAAAAEAVALEGRARFLLVLDGIGARSPPGVVFAVNLDSGEADAPPEGLVTFFSRLDGGQHRPGEPHSAPRPLVIEITGRLREPALRSRVVEARAVPVRFTPVGALQDDDPAPPQPEPGSVPFIAEAWIAVL